MTTALPPSLAEATLRFEHAAGDIIDTFEARRPAETNQVTPGQLAEAIEQFLAIIARIDREEGAVGPIAKEDATGVVSGTTSHFSRAFPQVKVELEGGQIVIRPMNYLALSYDHRIIDGREAVLSLVAIKEALEEPARLLLDL